MEDVLEVYQRQYGDNEVLVCLDETCKPGERTAGRVRPGLGPGSYDYEYERNGVSNLFMLFAPLEGWLGPGWSSNWWTRTPHKDRIAGDGQLEHPPPSLIVFLRRQPYPLSLPKRRIALTVGGPLHSQAWQLAAEIEIGVMARPMPEPPYSRPKRSAAGGGSVAATAQPGRNRVDWRFTTEDARIKLKFYPGYNTDTTRAERPNHVRTSPDNPLPIQLQTRSHYISRHHPIPSRISPPLLRI